MAGACDFYLPSPSGLPSSLAFCVQHLQVPSSFQELQLPSFLTLPCELFPPQLSSVGQVFSPAQF